MSYNTESSIIEARVSWATVRVILTAGLASFNYGYANMVIAGSFAQLSFIEKFLSGPNAASLVDSMLGPFFAFALFGAIGQAPISNKWGRRSASAVAAAFLTLSGALMAGAVNVAMFLVGRMLGGFGCNMVMANTPVYMSEVSPPHARGLLVGLQGVCIVVAQILAAAAAFGFHFIDSAIQWRLNFIITAVAAFALLVSLHFLPESPRWLVEKGRKDEAMAIIESLHRTKTDPNAVVAQAEMVQIVAQIEVERTLPKSFVYIFRTPHLRKRAICTLLVWTMGQSTGITVIANLAPVLFGNLGYSTVLQLGLGLAWCTCLLVGCFVNVALLDRIGRVKLLVAGGFGMCALLNAEAALEKYFLDGHNKAGTKAAVAVYFLIAVFFTSTIECTGYVYGSEIWPTYLRSQGATLNYFGFFVTTIWTTSPAAVAFQNIGWKFYMVFIAVTIPLTIAIMVLLPETAGLTLEEIGAKFGDAVEVEFAVALNDKIGEAKTHHKPEHVEDVTPEKLE